MTFEQKLAQKDPTLRRFIELACDVSTRLNDEDQEYVRRYVNGLIAGGKTWARAEQHFVSGIFMKLFGLRKTDKVAAEACLLAEQWLKKHKLL